MTTLVFLVVFFAGELACPELAEGVVVVEEVEGVVVELVVVVVCPEFVERVDEGPRFVEVLEVVATGTAISLSLLNTVNPAIGILETLISFTGAIGGVVPETLTGGVVTVEVFLLLPKEELNCENKLVPVVPPFVLIEGLLKYRNPKTAIIMI